MKTTVHQPGQPHKTDPKAGTQSTIHLPPSPKLSTFIPKKTEPAMSHGFTAQVLGTLALTSANATSFVDATGAFEVDVPDGAVSAADVSAAGGKVAVRITEIAPPSGSLAGGSGNVSFGTYLLETVDAKGNHTGHGLRKDAALKLHYGNVKGFDLSHAVAVFNGAHPANITMLGQFASQKVTNDATNHVLAATWPADPAVKVAAHVLPSTSVSQGTPNTTVSWNTLPPVAKYGGPSPVAVALNSGTLTEGSQIALPPGPAGALPNLTLAYNSGAVSEQHSPQGAAGWVGEGWNLGLGEIDWSERNERQNTNTSTNSNWENTWSLTDPFGTSSELLPPNMGISTYYDDTVNGYFCSQSRRTPCPVAWHTADESYNKIYSYVSPYALPYPRGTSFPNPMCFRVYRTNGVMEEYGCTRDSIQYFPVQIGGIPGGGFSSNAGLYYPVRWLLDLVTNPQGAQVHVTYQSDTETGVWSLPYARDTHLATIEWDDPTCVNAAQQCASWNPQYRVSFAVGANPTRLTNTPTNCNTDTSQRCDDPLNIGYGAPLINSTRTLNDILVQTKNAGTWQTTRDYQLSYEQNGPSTITDPATGQQVSTAGYLDLTQLKEVGTDGTTAAPVTTVGYTTQTEYYEDSTFRPAGGNCGPTWNTGGNGNGCDLWSQSYQGNSRYLTTIDNGQGLQQSFTWVNARSNTHGSAAPSDPLYCNTHQAGYPCNSADDVAWSRIAVQERDDTVQQVTQNGQGGTPTTASLTSRTVYSYLLTNPLAAQECGDCVAGMYWGAQNDDDYLDYYNGHYMGFAQGSVSSSDGSLAIHHFYGTEGWGVYNTTPNTSKTVITCLASNLNPVTTTCHQAPWSDVTNVGHGLETEAFYFGTDGTTLLTHTLNSYQANCPVSGVAGTPAYGAYNWGGALISELDNSNPVMDCAVQLTQAVQTTVDGAAGNNLVTATAAYTYDGYGRVTQTTSTSNSGAPTQIIAKTSYAAAINTLVLPALSNANASQEAGWTGGLYSVNLPNFGDIEDPSGNRYSCHYAAYDGSANLTEQDTYTNCGTAPTYVPSGLMGSSAQEYWAMKSSKGRQVQRAIMHRNRYTQPQRQGKAGVQRTAGTR